MRHFDRQTPGLDFPAVFRPDPGAWRDDAPAVPTPGEILHAAGTVLGATLAAVLLIDALLVVLR